MRNIFFCYLYVSLVCFTGARMNGILSNSLLPRWRGWHTFANFQKNGEFTRQQLQSVGVLTLHLSSRDLSAVQSCQNIEDQRHLEYLTVFYTFLGSLQSNVIICRGRQTFSKTVVNFQKLLTISSKLAQFLPETWLPIWAKLDNIWQFEAFSFVLKWNCHFSKVTQL